MKPVLLRPLLLLTCLLWLGGCASFEADAPRGGGLAGVQRFFVLSNLNDNHAFDERIAAALRARGLAATAGPLTMMPDDAQAIVTFQDQWNWDMGEHLVYLRIAARKPDSNENLASATFSARIPLKETPTETVGRLVESLFDAKAAPARPPDQPAASPTDSPKRRR